jgi:hypothetical protein
MATIIREAVIDADARSVWDALRDFGALHERLARGFITDSRLESVDTREITFFNGAVARERLIGVDDGARRLAYSVIESRLNATHHNASMQVSMMVTDAAGSCRRSTPYPTSSPRRSPN